ncbi:S1 family peptidase [Actinoalloteichus hymeniacidonis]|uniref:Trypsin n=1 Tax=Actinoalloteichus hymeniacidonis TaxID=340345 RepID=A0AAC9MVZ8_9PSEU|nr:serine protease [Actinoalloteichus hymeniacidonis]AOS61663.1 Trypsin [Actinoalloteichus hymeniacidonis]MBB5910323.1 secreted trypsin-like serine protease [Actinoalloteichus hymeniacidonis]
MRLRKSIAAVFAAAVAPVLIATAGPASATEDADTRISQVSEAEAISDADRIETMIVGGRDATEDYPFIATFIRPDGSLGCSGSLVDENWVVTAAHCVYDGRVDGNTLRVGSINGDEGGTVVDFTEIIIHPDYDDSEVTRVDMDIALLRLENPIPDAQPITLQARRPADDQFGLLLGWGQQCAEPGGCGQADILQELEALIDNRMDCQYGFNAETELCHVSAEGTGPCYGDSGGPMLAEREGITYLAGVTARIAYPGEDGASPTCAQGVSISTDVAYHYSWIQSHIAA